MIFNISLAFTVIVKPYGPAVLLRRKLLLLNTPLMELPISCDVLIYELDISTTGQHTTLILAICQIYGEHSVK